MKPQIWHSCYDSSWKGFITPAAYCHPAKYSRGLIERIFDHCLTKGYLKRGDVCGDAFGGIGTGGIIAAYRGIEWVGVELEPKFVGLADENFKLHHSKLTAMGLPWPRIIQGDSRQFHVLVGGADSVVASPPYMTREDGGGIAQNGDTSLSKGGKQLGRSCHAIVSSPPYAVISTGAGGLNTKPAKHAGQQSGRSAKAASQDTDQKYGQAAGQIAALKEGSVSGVISSPPYADSVNKESNGIDWTKAERPERWGNAESRNGCQAAGQHSMKYAANSEGQIGALKSGSVDGVVSSPPFRDARSDTQKSHPTKHGGPCAERHHTTQAGAGYGDAEGQIDSLATGDVHAVVTSPPWEKNDAGGVGANKLKDPAKFAKEMSRLQRGHAASAEAREKQFARDAQRQYGDSPGQIGKESSENYWMAMDKVYRSCFQAIKPGGVIVLVVKDYVKGGKRVPLCDDTVRLIEHIGFTMVERIHTMLVKETRHGDLFSGETVTKTERKSFFRRLHEKKPNAVKIDWEEVLICQKPVATAERHSLDTEHQSGAPRVPLDSAMSNGSGSRQTSSEPRARSAKRKS